MSKVDVLNLYYGEGVPCWSNLLTVDEVVWFFENNECFSIVCQVVGEYLFEGGEF